MKRVKNNKGVIGLLIAIIIILLLAFGFVLFGNKKLSKNNNDNATTTTSTTTSIIKRNYSEQYFKALEGLWINCDGNDHLAVNIKNEGSNDIYVIGVYATEGFGGIITNIEYKNGYYEVTYQGSYGDDPDSTTVISNEKIYLNNNTLTINNIKYTKSSFEEADNKCGVN